MKKRATGKGSKTTTTTTTTTPRQTDRARCTRTGRNGCGTERVRCTCREPVTIFVRPCVVMCCVLCLYGALGEPPELSAAPPVAAVLGSSSSSSCETGYDGQTSGYQRVDDDDVTILSTVEETDGRTDGPMDRPTGAPTPSSTSAATSPTTGGDDATYTCSQRRHGIIIISSAVAVTAL